MADIVFGEYEADFEASIAEANRLAGVDAAGAEDELEAAQGHLEGMQAEVSTAGSHARSALQSKVREHVAALAAAKKRTRGSAGQAGVIM